jgi:hypothetical protein
MKISNDILNFIRQKSERERGMLGVRWSGMVVKGIGEEIRVGERVI